MASVLPVTQLGEQHQLGSAERGTEAGNTTVMRDFNYSLTD